jgi:hypothetical protein
MSVPDFIQNGELTPAGLAVKTRIEMQIAAAQRLVEDKKDIGYINGLAGHLKHYYVNVASLRSITPALWLKEQTYAASVVWGEIEAERQLAEEAAVVQGQQNDTNARLDRLEALIVSLSSKLAATPEPAKAEGDSPAETPAEEAVEDAPPVEDKKAKK